ncbi:haloacid dehalogenase-like hydrolase [Eisenbergiella tayi]|uniref:Haloacid dehalogenase-like hydrolase n=2 Tax=Eisenbergiella porci TaxID=2652274 RepID=A0A6N7W6I6_9FIRM|nr:haloacid dehalogenase-like hydrolase [Eisenbergiella porci]
MEQNTIAVIWDFDKTLIPGYMQEPIFSKFGIDANDFWNEVNSLPQRYAELGIRVNNDTIYLNHMITCANQGIFPELDNELLKKLGKDIEFYEGVPEIFQALKDIIRNDDKYTKFGIHVEHYIVSTGLTAMIKGSKVNNFVDGIWGCEFIETPFRSNLETRVDEVRKKDVIHQTGYIIDNTSKTRAIFEINKGVNKFEYIDVNSRMDKDDRRVPFENMVYIADGPSDVPVFSLLQQYGGKTFAVYPKGNIEAFNQVDGLRRDGRIDMFAEADYSEGTMAYMWLTQSVLDIADRIYNSHDEQLKSRVKTPPRHLIPRLKER